MSTGGLANLRERILDLHNLSDAWQQVLTKKPSAAAQKTEIGRFSRNWEANLVRLREQAAANTYRPLKPRLYTMRTKKGKVRVISRLHVRDKVLQRAVLNIIDPEFDRRFLGCCHGYRKRRGVATAVERVLRLRDQGLRWVLDADITDCFGNIRHDLLLRLIQRVMADHFTVNLITLWLATYHSDNRIGVGIPLGAVLSPLWCNIYLHQLDARLSCSGWQVTRYADDFIIHTSSKGEAERALGEVNRSMDWLQLSINPNKTCISSFEEGFLYLGVTFHRDSYSYEYQDSRIEVGNRSTWRLWRHPPEAYGWEF